MLRRANEQHPRGRPSMDIEAAVGPEAETIGLDDLSNDTGAGKTLLRLINCLDTGGSDVQDEDAFTAYSSWYLQHLRKALDRHLKSGGRDSINALLPQQQSLPADPSQAVSHAMSILVLVAQGLASQSSSLASMLSHLSGAPSLGDGETDYAPFEEESGSTMDSTLSPDKVPKYQSLFTAVSWLLKVYSTASPGEGGAFLSLDMKDPSDTTKQLRSGCWKRISCPLTPDKVGMEHDHLLNGFGALCPPTPTTGSAHAGQGGHGAITSNNLSYYTLVHLAGIKVVWVDSLSLHLEFDARTSTLKLFRFPTFCAMLALPRSSQRTIFDTVFPPSPSYGGSDTSGLSPYAQDFFVEVLCSYRLIFGQHHPSRRLYNRHFSRRRDAQDPADDPLLGKLCGQGPRSWTVFSEVQAFPVRAVYSTQFDFRFLGPRLLLLQDFMNIQSPSGLRGLWYDVRDLNRFYTFWAVLVVGGISIALSIIQTVLTGLSLRSEAGPAAGGKAGGE